MPKAFKTGDGWRKVCCTCRVEFCLDNFFTCRSTPDNLNRRCKSCASAAVTRCEDAKKQAGIPRLSDKALENKRRSKREAYASNPELFRETSRVNRAHKKEATQASSLRAKSKKPEHYRAYAREYYAAHRDVIGPKNRERTIRRYIGEQKATPGWATQSAIDAIYRTAAELTSATGIRHEVDHIVPITSKIVCGLHVESNLRVITKTENLTKGNRWWPDHPAGTQRDALAAGRFALAE